MPRYTSRTGRNVILRFQGTVITVPINGFYETSAENLDSLFPDHIKKLKPDEIIKETLPAPLHVEEISGAELSPVEITKELVTESIEFPGPLTTFIPIDKTQPIVTIVDSPKIIPISIPTLPTMDLPTPETISLKSPIEMTQPTIKNIPIKKQIVEIIQKTINNGMENAADPDLKEFLSMIEDILRETND